MAFNRYGKVEIMIRYSLLIRKGDYGLRDNSIRVIENAFPCISSTNSTIRSLPNLRL